MKKVAHPNEIQNTKVINSVYNYHSICMCYLRKSFIRTMDITFLLQIKTGFSMKVSQINRIRDFSA